MRIWFLAFLFASMCAAAHAQMSPRAQLQADLANAENDEVSARQALEDLNKKGDRLSMTQSALKRRIDDWKQRNTSVNDEARRYSEAVQVQKSRCGGGTSTNAALVQSCNNKKRDLDSWQSSASARYNANETERRGLEQESVTLVSQFDTVAAAMKSNTHKLDNAIQKIDELKARIASLTPDGNNACSSLSPGTSDEEAKLKCGNVQFDNANRQLPSGNDLEPKCQGLGCYWTDK